MSGKKGTAFLQRERSDVYAKELVELIAPYEWAATIIESHSLNESGGLH